MNATIEKPQVVFEEAQTYPTYVRFLKELLEQDRTTGPNQSEEFLNYTRQNMQRKKRFDKVTRVPEDASAFFQNLTGNYKWLVISEGWCGDAATTLPVLNKLAELSDNIEYRITLRDEHPSLMDQFLTNGSKSIPVLVILDADTDKVLGQWGPRPLEAQQLMVYLRDEKGMAHLDLTIELQKWYAKDKGLSTINEVFHLMETFEK